MHLFPTPFLPLLLPLPSPCSPALNGLIHLLISSTITHLWTKPKHLGPASLHSSIPFSEHMQTFCHQSSFPNPYHTFTLRFLSTPLSTLPHCGIPQTTILSIPRLGIYVHLHIVFPRVILPTPQDCLLLCKAVSATWTTASSGWARRWISSPHRETARFEHILGV